MKLFNRHFDRFHAFVWGGDLTALSVWRRRLVLALRMLYAVGRDLGEGQLTLRAMSLVYTTLLSLVPLLALSFSVLKGLGVQNQVRPMLLTLLEPLGDKGIQIADQMIAFVNHIKVGVLGALGLGMLVYTVVTLLQKIEDNLNFVWRVKSARPLPQRFSQYLSVLMIGPLLMFSAMGVTGAFFGSHTMRALIEIHPLGALVGLGTKLLPFLFVIAAFSFIYQLMPNTRVRMVSALVGGTVAGILWQTLGWGFAAFIAGSSNYTAIYAGFAIVIFSMIWLYLNWLIVLIGASIACYHQYPALLATPHREFRLSSRLKEKIALLAATLIGRNYYGDLPPWSLEELSDRIGVPGMSVEPVLAAFQHAGYLTETTDDPPRYVPAHAFESITVKHLLDTIRRVDEDSVAGGALLAREAEVESLITHMDEAVETALAGRTLRDLVMAGLSGDAEGQGGPRQNA